MTRRMNRIVRTRAPQRSWMGIPAGCEEQLERGDDTSHLQLPRDVAETVKENSIIVTA